MNTQGSKLALERLHTNTATKTWLAYSNSPGMHVNTRCINSTRGTSSVYLVLTCMLGESYVPCIYMPARWELCTLYLHACQVRVMYLVFTCMPGESYVPCIYMHARWELCTLYLHVCHVRVMYLAFTCMPGESYHRQVRSLLLCLCCVFQALINSLVCRFCMNTLGLILFQICPSECRSLCMSI